MASGDKGVKRMKVKVRRDGEGRESQRGGGGGGSGRGRVGARRMWVTETHSGSSR